MWAEFTAEWAAAKAEAAAEKAIQHAKEMRERCLSFQLEKSGGKNA